VPRSGRCGARQVEWGAEASGRQARVAVAVLRW
jgi:hypothetical protein